MSSLTGGEISQLTWLEDGRSLVILAESGGRVSVVKIDTDSGELSILAKADSDIKEYSTDSKGEVVVFATEEPRDQAKESFGPTAQEAASGYRIPFEDATKSFFSRRRLYVTHRRADRTWTVPQPLILRSAFSHNPMTAFPYLASMHLSLSPDARTLLVTYIDQDERLPPEWETNEYVKLLRANGFPGILPTLMVDMMDGSVKLAIESPYSSNTPLWAKDSRSFVLTAISPINSLWDKSDQQNKFVADEKLHLFHVERDTGKVDLVITRTADSDRQPLHWNRDGRLTVRSSADTVINLVQGEEGWKVSAVLHIPLVNA